MLELGCRVPGGKGPVSSGLELLPGIQASESGNPFGAAGLQEAVTPGSGAGEAHHGWSGHCSLPSPRVITGPA